MQKAKNEEVLESCVEMFLKAGKYKLKYRHARAENRNMKNEVESLESEKLALEQQVAELARANSKLKEEKRQLQSELASQLQRRRIRLPARLND
jgi:predicted RNase H-like nuclease (RuvC/YqgF family)